MLEFKVYLDKKLIQRSLLSKGEITVGRSSENDLVLPNQHVSRLHLVIAQEGDAFRLEDRSSNGVLLDGKPVAGSTLLPRSASWGSTRLRSIAPVGRRITPSRFRRKHPRLSCKKKIDDKRPPLPTRLSAAISES
ncbi:MAG: FHA domain-containing protein [Candidatus Manganitrophus sp.]|nr:FHA domain-containing protein [Candidatus Manganitrophus sp.]WDT80699.1 MAG: FHA domain-containing protein [Candidatus Manganitrophus sp.]